MEPTFGIAFLVGFLSTVHCFGMCTGIMGALTLSLPTEIRARPNSLLPYVLAYNLGRVSSYTIVGWVFGALSSVLASALTHYYGSQIFLTLATAMLVGLGLYLGGWFPKFALLERAGRPLWRRLEPSARRLLPVRSVNQAFLFGTLWGWLPCGLVYSMLIWSLTTGQADDGALLMMAFGLGTLPTVLLAGVFINKIVRFTRLPLVRKLAGVGIIAIAASNLTFDWVDAAHDAMVTVDGVPHHEHQHR